MARAAVDGVVLVYLSYALGKLMVFGVTVALARLLSVVLTRLNQRVRLHLFSAREAIPGVPHLRERHSDEHVAT